MKKKPSKKEKRKWEESSFYDDGKGIEIISMPKAKKEETK